VLNFATVDAPALSNQSASWALATADLFGVTARILDDGELLAERLDGALSVFIGAIAWRAHRFAPRGVSLVGTALGGRVIVHTWPEREALTIDLYGAKEDAERTLGAGVERFLRADRAPRLD
jgi:S-adenosylmethionine/arginine decarboxylase-like enzyme